MSLEKSVSFYNTYEGNALRVYFSFVSFMNTFDNVVSAGIWRRNP